MTVEIKAPTFPESVADGVSLPGISSLVKRWRGMSCW